MANAIEDAGRVGSGKVEAEELIRQKEGHLCMRFYQRADGTVMTADCPIGLRAWRRRVRTMVALAATLLLLAFGLSAQPQSTRRTDFRLTRMQPLRALLDWIDPPCIMGTPAPPPSPRIAPNGQQPIGGELPEVQPEEN